MPSNNKKYKLYGDEVTLVSQTSSTTTYKKSNGDVLRIGTKAFREKASLLSNDSKTKDSENLEEIDKRIKELDKKRGDKSGKYSKLTPSESNELSNLIKKRVKLLQGQRVKDDAVRLGPLKKIFYGFRIYYTKQGYMAVAGDKIKQMARDRGKRIDDTMGPFDLTISGMERAIKDVLESVGLKEGLETKDSKKVEAKDSKDYSYKIKCGADLKEVTVKAGTEEDAKKQIVEIAKNLKYKGKQIKTKWDK